MGIGRRDGDDEFAIPQLPAADQRRCTYREVVTRWSVVHSKLSGNSLSELGDIPCVT